MKKAIVSLVAGFLIAGTAATSVSAQEYNIKEGDTLDSIAKSHDTTVQNLKDINSLDTNMIFPGETLDIDEDQGQYEVQKGDTLGSISKEFDVSVDDLKEWNSLDSDLIVEGQMLHVTNAGSANNEEAADVQENANPEDDQAELNQVAPDEDEEAAEADQQDAEPADEQPANDEADQQADTDGEAVQDNQENNNQAEEETANEESSDDNAAEGETISVQSTAYTAQCEGCSGTTTDGTQLSGDEKVIAVDPDVIPLGSKVHVEGYGDAVAADTGGAINGNKIDVHVPNEGEANAWGNKNVDVTILD